MLQSAQPCVKRTHVFKPVKRSGGGLGRTQRTVGFVHLLLAALMFAPPAQASSSETSLICDEAARFAAKAHAVPLSVLRAVTRTETGRGRGGQLEPWPWTVNMQGIGKWFASRDAAKSYVFRHFKAGARSFDVGCFQINYKWHHKAFRSMDDMFDPVQNATYAASFLAQLKAELGSWDAAVGAYHSRTDALAERYLKRYQTIHAALPDAVPVPAPFLSQRASLFGSGAASADQHRRFGSLVPADAQARPLFQGTP